MAVRIERGGWLLILLIGVGLVGYALKHYGYLEKIAPSAKVAESTVPKRVDLPALNPSVPSNVPAAPLPGTAPGCADKPEVRMLVWAWNAQMGLMFANGGPRATTGSLMCKEGVNLNLIRQDDSSKMQEALVAFATELKDGDANPSKGAHFVAIMGDGSAAFLKGVNDTLRRLGPAYIARVVGSGGFSRGEDKLMAPPDWKGNPAASRGSLVAGVLRDGDWNIAQKWLGDNGLCSNPDEKTYDASCMNWVNASDYLDAPEKYIANYCEDRPVVSNGKRTGETKHVCVNGVVTWTPGDVNVAQKRGGLVPIVSTHEYTSQMPHVVIGIDKWMRDNRSTVEGILKAMFDGADQVKSVPGALHHAAEVSSAVYNEKNADASYWEKYFIGAREADKQGMMVELGGSTVNNLADNLQVFGLAPGSANLFAATYTVFGDIVVSQYPDLVPKYPPVKEILDTSYIQDVAQRAAPTTAAQQQQFSASEPVSNVISRKSWHINFDTGKATFTPSAMNDLNQLLRDLLVAGGTAVEVHGHTDNAGSIETNQKLSEDRAFAVKNWLEQQSPVNFPPGRVRVFAHGPTNPIASNSTPEGRAQNRRVEIVLGTTATR
ncbi:MAG TPA: OmpA family protein [Bryobacteraceae bacterium]|nr:OmpA family protein [Bryobacteraceae bacterium]